MKQLSRSTAFAVALGLAGWGLAGGSVSGEEAVPDVKVKPAPGKTRVEWATPPNSVPHSTLRQTYRLYQSTDLKTWSPTSATATGTTEEGEPPIFLQDVPGGGPSRYFKLEVDSERSYLADTAADGRGYNGIFAQRLALRWGMQPAELPAAFPPLPGSDSIGFDPTTATYWSWFDADPAVWNAAIPPGMESRAIDYRLNTEERQKFLQNGFVASERLGSHSFADAFYNLWTEDLPVYFSADAALHAWHKSFDTFLVELEEIALRDRLEAMIVGMRAALANAVANGGSAGLADGLKDADLFLTVAKALLDRDGGGDPTTVTPVFSENAVTVADMSGKVLAANGWQERSLFGGIRLVDYTQFKPRAHYTVSRALRTYFRAMQWCSFIDFRMAGGDPINGGGSPRQLGGAATLTLLQSAAGVEAQWSDMDRVLRVLVGEVDSATPPQLRQLMISQGLNSFATWTDPAQLTAFQTALVNGTLGVAQVPSALLWEPHGNRATVYPRTFNLIGQRWVPDSWVLAQSVLPNIWVDNPDYPVSDPHPKAKVRRRIPSAIDIAFAVFGNNTVSPLLADRMTTTTGLPFRDGFNFAHQISAVRDTIDAQTAEAWEGTMYGHWLGALRSLSGPIPGEHVPEVMKTKAWQWSTVNSQLASWTHLRHDTLLYTKATYTPPSVCSYPDAYVEPRPAFWHAMQGLTSSLIQAIAPLELSGVASVYRTDPIHSTYEQPLPPVDRASRKAVWINTLGDFQRTMEQLEEIAATEVEGQPLSVAQIEFMNGMVEAQPRYSCAANLLANAFGLFLYPEKRTYTGWYPGLFLVGYASAINEEPHPSDKWEPVVVDVHSDAPSLEDGDPGVIVHEGTGWLPLMTICVNFGNDRRVFAGPMMSHYEFLTNFGVRKTDAEWKAMVEAPAKPAHPEWTQSYLVPGPHAVPLE